MDVGHHYIANREIRGLSDGCAQTLSVAQASAGVHHGDRFAADNEADVGDGSVVGWCCVFVYAAAEVDAWGDFVGFEGWGGLCCRWRPWQSCEADCGDAKDDVAS